MTHTDTRLVEVAERLVTGWISCLLLTEGKPAQRDEQILSLLAGAREEAGSSKHANDVLLTAVSLACGVAASLIGGFRRADLTLQDMTPVAADLVRRVVDATLEQHG